MDKKTEVQKILTKLLATNSTLRELRAELEGRGLCVQYTKSGGIRQMHVSHNSAGNYDNIGSWQV